MISLPTLGQPGVDDPVLARIRSLDTAPTGFGAVATVDEQWKTRAAAAPTPGLEGVTVLVKDSIDVAGLPTTAGSRALAESVPDRDADIIANLRRAGAGIVGKTNLQELCGWVTFAAPGGYSARGGSPRNPRGHRFPTGGSSSGSAAAAAAGLVDATIGTDTGGSILVPAANCGVYGLRPTVGLLSRRGALPITLAQDTPGPLALRVAHLAAALGGMRPDDHRRYHDALRVDRLAGARIALCLAGPEADAQTAWADAVATLLTAGVDLRPATTAIPVDGPSDLLVPAFDFRDSVGEYFDALPAGSPVRDFDTLYAHYRDATPDEQPYGIDNIEASARVDLRADRALRNRLRADEYDAAQRVLEHLREIDGVDAVLFPGPLATFLASKSGHPAVALPAGTLPGGRPFALSLLATRPDDEQYLLDLAASWEHLNGPTPSACP
ncbi:amidase [Microbacterium testaceum]|uniref:amidase family protein n=1 Tax=Microbacterium testaceum TaxID=2033 RepID=UPI001AE70F83|nr:amidase family protein [Microbacterium testaceum]MDQ1111623.1 amidase [Microbacterium testaceum]